MAAWALIVHRVVLAVAAAFLALGVAVAGTWILAWYRDPRPFAAAPSAPTGLESVLVESPTTGRAPAVVVYVSGIGGWNIGDQEFTASLNRLGYPVVALDSFRYFARPRTPASVSRDLEIVGERYRRLWNRPRIILAGYSFGAGAILEVAPVLSAPLRQRLRGVALIAPDRTGALRLRPYSFFDIVGPGGRRAVDQIRALRYIDVVCISGAADPESACPDLRLTAREVRLQTDHLFKGKGAEVATAIGGAGLRDASKPSLRP